MPSTNQLFLKAVEDGNDTTVELYVDSVPDKVLQQALARCKRLNDTNDGAYQSILETIQNEIDNRR